MIRWVAGSLMAFWASAFGVQAANFTNLDFEVYVPDSEGFFADVPGWGNMMLDPYPLEGASFGLNTTNNEYGVPLDGNASLFLGTGSLLFTNEIWVSQTADVPTNATHIRFLTTLQGVGATLGDILLAANVPEEVPPGVYRYTTDISSQAGLTATLKIALGWSEWGRHQLDQIEFLNSNGDVIWPPPLPPPAISLEDFHAATLNPSLWEVATVGQTNSYSIASEMLRTIVNPPTAPFETDFRHRATLRGDWDVRMDFRFDAILSSLNTNNSGIFGMALAADFGPDRTSKARVGQMITISNQARSCGVDWGQGPTGMVATAAYTGVFRLVRTGWEVAGYVWDAGSNDWRIVGASGEYTDDVARVGLKVWSTGTFSGKSAYAYSDNLKLAQGQASLDGLAIKVFGLDGSGAPSVAWDPVGIPVDTRYAISRATSLAASAWTRVSGLIGESVGEMNWTGAGSGAGPFYYRIEVVPPD